MSAEPKNIIDIPRIEDYSKYESNQEKAYSENFEACPCCGRAIKNPKYFFNSIYGGSAYPAADKTIYDDAWVMGVGTECRKKFPEGYIFEKK
jgi:hypothetical protein